MSNSINLVSTKNEQIEREQKVLLAVRVIAVSMLTTVAIISISAFVIGITNPLSQIKQQENSTLSGISSLHNKLTSYYLIKDRINNISNLETTRKDYTKSMDLLLSQAGSDINVNSISIEKNVITIEFISSSLVPLNKMIDDSFAQSSKGKIIKNVKLDSLSLDAREGLYSVVLEAEAI